MRRLLWMMMYNGGMGPDRGSVSAGQETGVQTVPQNGGAAGPYLSK
jgi:hypothetical protein